MPLQSTSSKSPSSSRTTARLTTTGARAPRRAANGTPSLQTGCVPALLSRPTPSAPTTGSLRLGKVDTSLRSYNRQDPFTAITTLIKLLTSIPSRVLTGGGGGCQYKLLTLDEHKLSIHLCNIIEPFVLSATTHCDETTGSLSGSITHPILKPRVLLVRQPTEILDRITSYIDNREDLLGFGLTCKRLSQIVFPRHSEYRIIRAKVSMIGVWKHLIERLDLAANVRVLEILDERTDRRVLVPRACHKIINFNQTSKTVVVGAVGHSAGGIRAGDVVSGTSTDEDSSSVSGNEIGGIIVGGMTKKVSIHQRHEKYFVAALERMSCLLRLKWEANHSPISVLDEGSGMIWRTLVEKCGGGLVTLEVADNLSFSPLLVEDDEEEDSESEENLVEKPASKAALINLRSISLRATNFSYGAPKEPSMARISLALHQCPNIENLELVFKAPKTGTTSLPVANELLTCGRWSHLRSLTLTNLSSLSPTPITNSQPPTIANPISTVHPQNPLQTFLSAHPTLEVLKLVDMAPVAHFRRLRTPLGPNSLPRLRELHANKDIVNMILKSNCDIPRPLEVITGFKLAGAGSFNLNQLGKHPAVAGGGGGGDMNVNAEFYQNLKNAGRNVKRIEIEGWGDLDDVKALALCVPKLTWLDIGRRLRPTNSNTTSSGNPGSIPVGASGGGRGQAQAPVTNMVEWAEVLSGFDELTTFHGVKFFYEIAPGALPNSNLLYANDITNITHHGHHSHPQPDNTSISKTDRSRIKKNDEIASVLAWKCPKLKRVDHWDSSSSGGGSGGGKVIVLFRDSEFGQTSGEGSLNKVRWDVRRVKGSS